MLSLSLSTSFTLSAVVCSEDMVPEYLPRQVTKCRNKRVVAGESEARRRFGWRMSFSKRETDYEVMDRRLGVVDIQRSGSDRWM